MASYTHTYLLGEPGEMRAIELFAGIGGFRLGLQAAGIEVKWANDIDPKCCAVYRAHFGDQSVIHDDIACAKWSIPEHDLLTAGFPCQPFSSAGKKEGVRDRVRGTLFAEIVDVLEAKKPAFFILENVKRLLTMEQGRHFKTILLALSTVGYGLEWRVLNAKDFGLAQNRERVFLVGRRNPDYLDLPPETSLSEHTVLLLPGDLDHCRGLLPFSSLAELAVPLGAHKRGFGIAGFAFGEKVCSLDVPPMPAQRSPKLLRDVLELDPDHRFDFTHVTNGWLKNNTEVNSFINGVEILSNQEGGRRMGYTIFGIGGLAPTLTATTSRHYERYRVGKRYRRLTNVEYARLQGFPDDWCSGVTIYDQYALYGNAVPPPMIEWVAKRVLERWNGSSKDKTNARQQGAAAAARP